MKCELSTQSVWYGTQVKKHSKLLFNFSFSVASYSGDDDLEFKIVAYIISEF